MSKIKIVVENSAPSQVKPAKSVVWACNLLKNDKFNVADIGCGRLRNLVTLNSSFSSLVLVDTKNQCERIRNSKQNIGSSELLDFETFISRDDKFDVVFIICVLHIIPDIAERKRILDQACIKLKENSFLVIDVPSGVNYYRKRMSSENKYKDGYLFGSSSIKTFYKNYHRIELDKFVTKNRPLSLYRKTYFDKHLVRIYRKCNQDAVTEQS